MEIQIPLTIVELFKFLGTPVFIGFLVSFLLERVPAFQLLSSDMKAIVSLVLAVLLPIVSYALLNYVPMSLIEALQPWYAAAITGVIGFIGSQVWHKLFKPENYIMLGGEDIEQPPEQKPSVIGTAVNFTPDDDVQAKLSHTRLQSEADATWRPGIGFYHGS